MDPFQYPDIPQIPMLADEHSFLSVQQHWGQYQSTPQSGRYFGCSKGGLNTREVNGHSPRDMQPMQRFLRGVDPPPFSPGMHHSDPGHFQSQNTRAGQYVRPWPSSDFVPYSPRHPSPDRTSTSGASSYAHELRSPCTMPTVSFGGTDSFHHHATSYPSPEYFSDGPYSADTPVPENSINLRDIELHHEELDAIADDAEHFVVEHGDAKAEFDYGQPSYHPATTQVTAVETYEAYHDPCLDPAMPVGEEVQPMAPSSESDSDYSPSGKSNKRRKSNSSRGAGKQNAGRRSRKDSTASAQSNTPRVHKKRRIPAPRKSKNTVDSNTKDSTQRPFPCPLAGYGCQSDFASKNEWKRHVSTQHIKLGFWRCDLCTTTVDPHDAGSVYHNDFNRKDLFTQHLRRMHAPPVGCPPHKQKDYPVNEDNLVDHQQRCYMQLRDTPPRSLCLFCPRTFSGASSWDERMEHVGKHLEKDRKSISLDASSWMRDEGVEEWLVAEGLVVQDRNGGWKIGGGKPKRGSSGGRSGDESEEE